ncbi:hypothetical protein BH10PSE1_BH10PSE1_14410 [soil metagenome]
MTPEQTNGATKVADAVHEHRPADPDLVRGARPGSRILLILIVSAGAAAVLLLGMWFLSNGGFASQNPNNGQQAVDAQAFSGDSATPPAADAPTTSTGQAAPTATGDAPNVNAPTQPSN